MNRNEELQQLKEWRTSLHQIPELGLDLPETQRYLYEQLQDLDCQITKPIEYGLAAFFDAGREKTIAFRTDMDALPVREQTGLPFASKNEGRMHACGHDGHMSAMLLMARRVQEIYKDLDCNILLIFQPGEETPGGAAPILKTGLFETYNVAAVFGMHLWPLLEKGALATRKGPLMASATEVDIIIHGKAVHSARKQEGIDAVRIGMDYLQRAYAMEEALPKEVYRLLQFGKMEGGRVRNVVAGECVIQGTLRAFEDEYVQALRNGLEQIAADLEAETGAKIEIIYSDAYPAVINDEALTERVHAMRPDLELLKDPVMIAEDFACYQRKVPGIFFFLGTGTGIELHDSHFTFDEEILLEAADLFEQLAHLSF